jgi:DNA repair protein RecN (Recombination protein N)
MLAELNITHYALIDALSIEFESGFNVLTGETGAGKSIIVQALMLALGARGSREMIQTGKDRLVVQAAFHLGSVDKTLLECLTSLGVEPDDSLILHRELHESGRNVCRVNGIIVTVADLKRVGDQLVDIHSQRDHNLMLHREEHIRILDSYGGGSLQSQKEIVEETFRLWQGYHRDKQRALETIRRAERELDVFRFQLGEIQAAEIEPEEDRLLEERIHVLSHAEVLFRNANQAYQHLYGADASSLGQLYQAKKELEEMERIDGSLSSTAQRLDEILILVEDVSFTLRSYKEQITFDEDELNRAQSKLNKINLLKRKYGPELTDVLAFKSELEEKIHQIEDKDEYLSELDGKLLQARAAYLTEAGKLHQLRKEAGLRFAEEINHQIHFLAMPDSNVIIQVDFQESEASFSPDGLDQVEFFIRTNKGEDHKPLIKIASGGEVSRIMLAMKSIIGLSMAMKCLVFDEVDTGISGKAAGSVGKKLKELSQHTQIIAITHLPQIASMAQTHFEVVKDSQGEKTKTVFHRLDAEDRVRALAVMMDEGDTIKSRELSREILMRNGNL